MSRRVTDPTPRPVFERKPQTHFRQSGSLDELVRAVTEWHLDHFGRTPIEGPLADKLVEEAHEFRDAVLPGQRLEEAADVLIVLCAWAGRNERDLLEMAWKKLERVKARNQVERDIERGILPDDFSRPATRTGPDAVDV